MKNKFFGAALVFFLVSLFVSCSSSSRSDSFFSALDSVDSFIAAGSTEDAVKDLKSLQKKAYSSYEFLALYKRYIRLGEKDCAEGILLKGLKKLPDNAELCAVYSVFLMRQNRFYDAYPYSMNLLDTKYSSINSECILSLALAEPFNTEIIFSGKGFSKKVRKEAKKNFEKSLKENEKILKKQKKLAEKSQKKSANQSVESKKENVFYDERFIPIYKNAYSGSKNAKWLFNAASIYMKNGQLEDALSLYPKKVDGKEDTLFWSYVFYDCGLYDKSLEVLLQDEKFFAGDFRLFEVLALESDNYYILEDDENCQNVRSKIISKWNEMSFAKKEEFCASKYAFALQKALVNNAVYYSLLGDDKMRYENLIEAVNYFPYFEDALALYGNFAVELSRRPAEDALLQELRRRNFKTLKMEEADENPFVEVSDAISRMESAIKAKKTAKLVVAKEMLEDELYRDEIDLKSNSRVWKVLEENSGQDGNIELEIVHYAISKLLQNSSTEDAEQIFNKFIKTKDDADCALWELEYKAYFACVNQKIDESLQRYSKIVEKYSERSPFFESEGRNEILVNSCVNMAVIYDGTDQSEKALEILNKALGLCNSAERKSEILYRIASIYYSLGNSRDSVRTLQYSLNLNEKNKRSRILLKKLQDNGRY